MMDKRLDLITKGTIEFREEIKMYKKSEYIWAINIHHDDSERGVDVEQLFHLKSPTFPETDSKYKFELQLCPNFKFRKIEVYLNTSVFSEKDNDGSYFECRLVWCSSVDTIATMVPSWNEIRKGCIYCGSVKFEKLSTFLEHGNVVTIKTTILKELELVPNTSVQINKSVQNISNKKNETFEKVKNETLGKEKNSTSVTKLLLDLQNLFRSNKFSDFVIKFDDSQEILVHKNILAARSPVFSAMFQYDTSENRDGYTKITDIDKDTMHHLLYFVYTGHVAMDLSENEAKKLLVAADKYELEDLKQLCSETLLQNLQVSNALDILQLAELYHAADLKKCVAQFVLKNFKEVFDPKVFRDIEKQFPGLVTELLEMKMSKSD